YWFTFAKVCIGPHLPHGACVLETNVIWLGFVGSLLAGLCTSVGASAIFLVRQLSDRTEDVLLSSAAGVMLAATFFSLLLPAIGYGELLYASKATAVAVVVGGFLL